MTARYPLVLNGTSIEELQSTDTLAGVPVPESFPAGTAMLFVQAAAPTGWTLSTTHNNKALRIVSGSGGGSGGSLAFTTAFGSGSTDATTLSTTQMPGHTHSYIYTTGGSYGSTQMFQAMPNGSNYGTNTQGIQNTGGGGSHTHSLSLAVQYVDAIICVKA